VRIHVKPFVRWIWFGGVLIAAGGMITLFDRRYRVLRERRDVVVQDLSAAPARAGA
jgi:cytochrome c-type biogenesis protein CcmF